MRVVLTSSQEANYGMQSREDSPSPSIEDHKSTIVRLEDEL